MRGLSPHVGSWGDGRRVRVKVLLQIVHDLVSALLGASKVHGLVNALVGALDMGIEDDEYMKNKAQQITRP